MHIRVPVINSLLAMVRKSPGISCDRRRRRRVESAEVNDIHSQPQNKRRKVETPLCVNFECVMKINVWLGNNEITTVGIYGMGGIGKTTLARQLHSQILHNGTTSTDHIHVSVGMDFTIYKLQQQIVDAFGLDLESDKDVTRRAARIYAFLSRKDKCILFLDDLWDHFRREDVGIPEKCKLVVISRSLDVCHRLYCQKIIKVEPLSEEESWQLFHHSIGDYGVLDSKLVSSIRKLVYKECAGLPLAIIALANSVMGVVQASRWEEVLESTDPFSLGPTQLENMLNQLKLSYDSLNNVNLRHCFLYSALYPKGHATSKEGLIRLWIGERLIDDVPSLQAQYDMGHSIMNKLLRSCLLETCQDKRSIKMHDVVRRMALSIARNDLMPSNVEIYGNLYVNSLINSSISLIPLGTSLKCTCLTTLLLQHNPLEVIPESFFLNMLCLRVLSLSNTCIIRLPSSISALEELQVLDLSSCQKLKQVLPLAKLHKLKFLDLSQTSVEQLPRSLEMLKRLTELDLSSIPEPIIFSRGVLLALSKLKRLSCHVKGISHELQHLESLEFLDATFDNLFELGIYVRSQHWSTLECFHLQIGCQMRPKKSCNKGVSLRGCTLSGRGGEQIVLPYDIQELYLDDCSGFHSLSNILNPDNACGFKERAEVFSSLEICTISRCHDVKNLLLPGWMPNLQCLEMLEVEECARLNELIVEDFEERCYNEEKRAVINLPRLKQLVLNSLPQLNNIYNAQLVCASLQSFIVMDCPNLKRLPLSYKNVTEELVLTLEWIEGQQEWWDLLEWDDMKSKDLLKPFFRCRSSMDVCWSKKV